MVVTRARAPGGESSRKRALLLIAGLCALCGVAHADPSGPAGAVEGAQCKALETRDFSHVQDAPTAVLETRLVAASEASPAICQARGYVSPNIGFDLFMPSETWNGKLVEVGCGGFCGVDAKKETDCSDALSKGYACIGSNAGHSSSVLDGKWAYNNLPAKVDYAYRAVHVVGLAGKAIAERFYQSAPKRSYFVGCSGGGRQALVEAQRFPWDFDGIVARDPAIDLSGVFVDLLWNTLSVKDKSGAPVLSDANIKTLHAAVVAKCDLNDGIKDGLIGDPRQCKFDPAELACPRDKSDGCLSAAQVEAARRIYQGPVSSTGERTTKGSAMLGSEIGGFFGIDSYEGTVHVPALAEFAAEFFRYMGFTPDPGPQWRAADFDFDRDYKRLGMMEMIYASDNPDLRVYKARGGKLIVTQDWQDSGSPLPLRTIDYYETVERTMGGRKSTQEFFRLFMVPGADHCGGGDGAWAIDNLSYLDAWVEGGHPPDMILGAHPKSAGAKFPLLHTEMQFYRPIYPYPLRTRYLGHGDPNDAASFIPMKP
jgi:Tannase and feruloyl esterase